MTSAISPKSPSWRLVLASASSGRLDVLRRGGLDPEVLVSGVDESTPHHRGGEPCPDAACLTATLARRKAEAVGARAPGAFVIACDTVLEINGAIHAKPATPKIAADRWRSMRGRQGVIHTGHHVVDVGSSDVGSSCVVGSSLDVRSWRTAAAVKSTVVFFGDPSDLEVDAYVATGEPLSAAGAFTIDGKGAPFITGIEGDPGNVIGVSLPLLRLLFAELGISIVDLWAR